MSPPIRHHSQSTAVAASIQSDILFLKFLEKAAATTKSTIQTCSSVAMEWTSSQSELAPLIHVFRILVQTESAFPSILRAISTTFSATARQAGLVSSAISRLVITSTVPATVLLTGMATDASVTVTRDSLAAIAKKECAMTGPAYLKARHSIFRTAVAVAHAKMVLVATYAKSLSALQIRVKMEEAAHSRKLRICALA